MNAHELFEMLTAYPQPMRTDALNLIEEVTRNYQLERVSALLEDFADMLNEWKYKRVVEVLKSKYNERHSDYETELHKCEYALAMGTTDPIEWPEEPAPFVPPLPFPGCFDDSDVTVPPMYEFAVDALKSHLQGPPTRNQDQESSTTPETKSLPPELSTDIAVAIFYAVERDGYCVKYGAGYKWTHPTKGLLAFFIDEVSRILEMRPSSDRIPWSKFAPVFGLTEADKRTLKNEVSKYTTTDTKGAQKDKPEGWRELKIVIDEAVDGVAM